MSIQNKYIYLLCILLFNVIVFCTLNEPFEIKIFDKDKTNNYNIGDLLNMPYFFAGWDNKVKEEFKETYKQYTDSILYYYYSTRPDDEPIPNVQRIRNSVDTYINNNDKLQDLKYIVSDQNTLVVHLRSGDKGIVEEDYIETIKKVSLNYNKIIILSGIHSDTRYATQTDAINNLTISLNQINLNKSDDKEIILNLEDADTHLVAMRHSKNLLLHKGGFSTLGGLLFQNDNLYIYKGFEPKNNNEYMNYLQGNKIML